MADPRIPNETELQEVFEFFTENLRPNCPWSISQEYPQVMNSANLANFRVIKENGKVVSGAVMKNLLIKNQVGIFKVAAIGSVVTDSAHRNQGLSRSVLMSCIQSAKEQGCDFAILWTDLFDFYRKIGFEVAGQEISMVMDKEFSVPTQGLRFLDTVNIAPEAVLKLYSKHTTGSIRNAEDIRRSLKIPNTRLFTAWDKDNNIRAYAVEGKGADLAFYVHEWGGDVPAIMELLAHMRKKYGRTLTVISPAHSVNFIKQMKDHGAVVNEGILGMIKILNPENLMFKIKRYARFMGVDDFIFESREGQYYMGSSENLFKTDSELDLVKIIFGPLKPEQLHNFDEHTGKTLSSILPIPMWIWGWDSV